MADEYVETGIPFLRTLNVDRFGINNSDIKYITKEFHRRISKSRLAPGDVVIVRTGKPGTCAVIPDELVESNCSDLVIVRCGNEINNRFLCYYVNSAASSHISAHIVGAVQQHFNVASAKAMEIALPSLSEQKAIAHILGTLDDKIEQNRKTNETLEAIAKALFKSWFVDFDPVRAKAEGCPTGLPAEISDLFPDSFEDSELGEIPSGWEVKAISNLCRSISSGGTPSRKNSEYWIGGTISWFKTGELRDSFLLESEERITQAGLNESSCKYFDKGDILFALYGATVGKMGIVTAPSTANQAAACLRPLEEIGTPFLEGMLYATRERLMNIATGAAQQNLYLGVVKEHAVVAPCKPLPKMFSQLVDPINQRRLCCLKESSSLSSFRDALLPKLISGEIRIPDAKKMLEEVGV